MAQASRRRPDPEVRIGRVGVLRGPLGLRDQPAVGIGQPGEGRIVLDISGEEKKRLTVEQLISRFSAASGREFSNDRVLLGA